MISGNKIPFINENSNMKKALKLNVLKKNLEFLIAIDKKKIDIQALL